jgi:hypothetical protein
MELSTCGNGLESRKLRITDSFPLTRFTKFKNSLNFLTLIKSLILKDTFFVLAKFTQETPKMTALTRDNKSSVVT